MTTETAERGCVIAAVTDLRAQTARELGARLVELEELGFSNGIEHDDMWCFDFNGGWRQLGDSLKKIGLPVTHVGVRRVGVDRDAYSSWKSDEITSYAFLRKTEGDQHFVEICRWFTAANRVMFLTVANGIETEVWKFD